MPFIHTYLRASTFEQDATRARSQLEPFTGERGQTIAPCYLEDESGASLQCPELFRLLSDCREGDVLLMDSPKQSESDMLTLDRSSGGRPRGAGAPAPEAGGNKPFRRL